MHTVLSLGSGRRKCLGLCLGVGNPMEQTRGCWMHSLTSGQQSHRVHRVMQVTSQSPLMTSLLSCFSSLPSPQRSSKQPRQRPERPDATDGCAAEIPLDKKQIAEGTRRPLPPIYSDRVAVSPLLFPRGYFPPPPLSPYTQRFGTQPRAVGYDYAPASDSRLITLGPTSQAGSRGI